MLGLYYIILHYYTVLPSITQYHTVLPSITQYYTVSHRLPSITQYYTVLHISTLNAGCCSLQWCGYVNCLDKDLITAIFKLCDSRTICLKSILSQHNKTKFSACISIRNTVWKLYVISINTVETLLACATTFFERCLHEWWRSR